MSDFPYAGVSSVGALGGVHVPSSPSVADAALGAWNEAGRPLLDGSGGDGVFEQFSRAQRHHDMSWQRNMAGLAELPYNAGLGQSIGHLQGISQRDYLDQVGPTMLNYRGFELDQNIGHEQKQYDNRLNFEQERLNKLFPGTTPWERLGVSPAPQASTGLGSSSGALGGVHSPAASPVNTSLLTTQMQTEAQKYAADRQVDAAKVSAGESGRQFDVAGRGLAEAEARYKQVEADAREFADAIQRRLDREGKHPAVLDSVRRMIQIELDEFERDQGAPGRHDLDMKRTWWDSINDVLLPILGFAILQRLKPPGMGPVPKGWKPPSKSPSAGDAKSMPKPDTPAKSPMSSSQSGRNRELGDIFADELSEARSYEDILIDGGYYVMGKFHKIGNREKGELVKKLNGLKRKLAKYGYKYRSRYDD